MDRNYWKHAQSGETFAVETQPTAEGFQVTGVTGPLHYSEVSTANMADGGNFDFDGEDADYFQEHHEEYNVLENDLPGDTQTWQAREGVDSKY